MTGTDQFQYVAMGANVSSSAGDPANTLHAALVAIAQAGMAIRCVSRYFRTPCFPAGAGPDYVNAVIGVENDCSPEHLLEKLHAIERDFGRVRVERWGQRTLDLDLIAHGARVVPDVAGFRQWYDLDPDLQAKAAPDRLILPHPRIQDRAFVLVPFADIAPEWLHPVLGLSTRDMLAQLDPQLIAEVAPI